MSLTPADHIGAFLEAYSQAYPGQEAPHITYADGWFRIKEKGEHAGKMRTGDVMERCRELKEIVSGREFDLGTIAGIAAASDQAQRAAKAYLKNHLQHRIEDCTTLADLKTLQVEISMQCQNAHGFLVPMPPEIETAFFMRISALRAS